MLEGNNSISLVRIRCLRSQYLLKMTTAVTLLLQMTFM
jgi:hypothetical protein